MKFSNLVNGLVLFGMLLMASSCSVIAGIFNAGVGFGIFIVIAIIIVIVILIMRFGKKS